MRFLKKVLSNNNILSLTGNIIAAGFGFISFALLARIFSKEDFGNWILFITVYVFIELLRVGFLQTPLVKFCSGVSEREKEKVIGSAWLFAILITISFVVLCFLLKQVMLFYIDSEGAIYFFNYFWILIIVTLPYNFSSWILQVDMKFSKIIYIRLISIGVFIVLLCVEMFLHRGKEFIVQSYLISHFFGSLFCVIAGWTNIKSIRFAEWKKVKDLFNFGKFSMGTMVGANLLRSSDTFLIGAFLGGEAVAIFNIPLKLFELVEIPLRSFAATALPSFSRLVNSKDLQGLSKKLERTAGMFSIMLLPIVVFCIIFAEYLVVLLGGEGYEESANILRIFALHAALMPIDRYSGLALDVLSRPQQNMFKVIVMVCINSLGVFIVLKSFGMLWPVAIVSILTFSAGVIMGIFFLKRDIKIVPSKLFSEGFKEIKSSVKKLKSKLNLSVD
ncbi:hypothetical protein MYP_2493 [Sporocytophaga myxococcoides]|uniref:Polysaccharide biosynthesis protein C-terminal domain-containing protein n=1 Tax=Sporocytophaga myxococcoides TaxID=153721 RepID=A0A098LFM1_9BACT|nr:oligosaccharide flippase family protein [Sporocytophaga myxococcoides]GAL85264.1 hypothetical protein MYP_2493 [Sporocytophaga myxococcoides]